MGITIHPMKNRTFSVVQFFFLKSIIKLLQVNLIITLNCVQKVQYIVECPLIHVSVLTGFILYMISGLGHLIGNCYPVDTCDQTNLAIHWKV